MARKNALYLAVAVGSIAWCLAFGSPAVYPIRVFWYYPLEHRWAFELRPSSVAIDWFGRVLLAAFAGTVGFAVGWLAGHKSSVKAELLRSFAVWIAASAALVASLYAYQLSVRHPTPEPLPAWYQPR